MTIVGALSLLVSIQATDLPWQHINPQYTDISGHWAEHDIVVLLQLGFFQNSDYFYPNKIISEDDYSQLIRRLNKIVSGSYSYVVIDGEIIKKDVLELLNSHRPKGTPEITVMSADKLATRAEVSIMIHRYLQRYFPGQL